MEHTVDNVNHPQHYADSCSIECIEAMELFLGREGLAQFCLGNAFKYLWRHKNKNGEEDLEKARWYLNKAKELGWDIASYSSLLKMVNKYTVAYTFKEES